MQPHAVFLTYPSVQRCAAPLVLSIWQGTLLQQEVDTVSVTSQNGEHQRCPEGEKSDNKYVFFQCKALGINCL